MIVDAHIHLPAITPIGAYEQAMAQALDDLKKDKVDYAILIPDNVPNSPIADVPTCIELVKDAPQLYLMGTINLRTQGPEWIRELEIMLAKRQIVGMKIFPGHDPIYPTDPRLDPVHAMCQAYDAPMVIHTGWNSGHPEVAKFNDPKYIVQIAEKYPAMKIVIAHFFWPEVDYCYDVTHGYSNIYYDTSGLADEEVIEATGFERIRTVLLKTLQVDPKKIVFGTDYAMCIRKNHIKMIDQLPVTERVRERIFWRNAADLFKLPTPFVPRYPIGGT